MRSCVDVSGKTFDTEPSLNRDVNVRLVVSRDWTPYVAFWQFKLRILDNAVPWEFSLYKPYQRSWVAFLQTCYNLHDVSNCPAGDVSGIEGGNLYFDLHEILFCRDLSDYRVTLVYSP